MRSTPDPGPLVPLPAVAGSAFTPDVEDREVERLGPTSSCKMRERPNALGVLHRSDPEPEYQARLLWRRLAVLRLVPAARHRGVHLSGADPCGSLGAGLRPGSLPAHSEATSGGRPDALRPDDPRPVPASQPGRLRPRAEAYRRAGQDPGAFERRDGRVPGSLPTDTVLRLRDRALLGVIAYTFARIGTVFSLEVEDYYVQRRRGWLRLREKGGKVSEIPCHHTLEQYLEEYLSASGLAGKGSFQLFCAWRQGQLQPGP